jgi:hypothetical protein
MDSLTFHVGGGEMCVLSIVLQLSSGLAHAFRLSPPFQDGGFPPGAASRQ